MSVAASMLIGAGISSIAQIFASQAAAHAQTKAAQAGIDAELAMFGITKAGLQPYADAGNVALGKLLYGTPEQKATPETWTKPGVPAIYTDNKGVTHSVPASAQLTAAQKAAGWKLTTPGAAPTTITMPHGYTQTAAVKAQWRNPQGQTVEMPATWKPGAAQKGWVLTKAGAVAGHPIGSTWIGPNGQTVTKAWNFKPPAGQEANWKLVKPGQAPTSGLKMTDAGQVAQAATPGKLDEYLKPIDIDLAKLENTPGYQFSMQQGLKAVQNRLTAGGQGESGAAYKGAINYASGLAQQTFQQEFQRQMAQKEMGYNMLMGPSQLGESAAAGVGTGAMAAGSNVSQSLANIGSAQAGALTSAGSAVGDFGGSITSSVLLPAMIAASQAGKTPPPGSTTGA